MQELVRVDRSRVCALLPLFDDASYRQSWSYAELAARRVRAASEWFELRIDERTVALMNVRVRRLPFGLGGVALVSGGPMVRLSSEAHAAPAERFDLAVRALSDEFVRRRGLVLRIQAPLGSGEWNDQQASILASRGFRDASDQRRYRTLVKSIDLDEEALRRSLAQKWRNQLNVAGRQGFGMAAGSDPGLFDRFEPLFESTRQDKGFATTLDAAFYRRVGEASGPGEPMPWVIVVTHEGRDVSGHLGMSVGDTSVYLLGGTTEEGRRLKAAYWAQWQAMLHARAAGCRWYDLGGIDPEGNPGVYHFKEGLAGSDVIAAGPVEMRPTGLRAAITGLAESLYARRARGVAATSAPHASRDATGGR
ncbi:MAG: lipid II:glycine glycyltransferase FemX [Planctomycetota bacterium]